MKKLLLIILPLIILPLIILPLITGCVEKKTPVPEKTLSEVVDVDLTKLSGTMVYSGGV